ncbi:DUF5130 family protein [Rhodococcus sp. X156]|uniref:DUF5130 family protein n=1 Tax=Rhodococcus sp. X156 TaxID=2499145 RepID=UPI001F498A16|nr:DUF5130 family protein [Rhodococcus sp. X156]
MSVRGGEQLDRGVALMETGRFSVARDVWQQDEPLPFSTKQLSQVDEALTFCTRATGIDFSVYLGPLSADTRARAEELLVSTGSPDAVLIAVSPGERVVEVVTSERAQRRVSDRAARLAVMAMVASFRDGDLIGGILAGLRMLADQAGPGASTSASHH